MKTFTQFILTLTLLTLSFSALARPPVISYSPQGRMYYIEEPGTGLKSTYWLFKDREVKWYVAENTGMGISLYTSNNSLISYTNDRCLTEINNRRSWLTPTEWDNDFDTNILVKFNKPKFICVRFEVAATYFDTDVGQYDFSIDELKNNEQIGPQRYGKHYKTWYAHIQAQNESIRTAPPISVEDEGPAVEVLKDRLACKTKYVTKDQLEIGQWQRIAEENDFKTCMASG